MVQEAKVIDETQDSITYEVKTRKMDVVCPKCENPISLGTPLFCEVFTGFWRKTSFLLKKLPRKKLEFIKEEIMVANFAK